MRSVWVFAGVGLLFAAVVWSADGGVAAPISAVWKEQQLSFFYMGRTSRYSCSGLRDKVRALLLELGARRNLTVTALGCDEPAARARLGSLGPSLNIMFAAPALPQTSQKPPHPANVGAVDAQFESFTITNDVFRDMGIADCELVQEFARQILPRFVIRNTRQDILCVPSPRSGSHFLIRGEILRSLQSR
jgi:hypothetical protein